MSFTLEEKRAETLRGPIDPHFLRHDSTVVDTDGWYRVITPSTPWPAVNEVVLSALDEHDPEPEIERLVAAYREHDLPLKWCVYPWTKPADLGERLVRRGAISWRARGMVTGTALELALPEGASVERIDRATFPTYLDAMVRGWELPPIEASFMHERMGSLLSRPEPPVQLFVARWHGEVAASAATMLKERSGYLMGANVLPAFRGCGLYRALLRGRLAALSAMGIELATTQAREQTSAPILEHLGFETVFRYKMYQLNPRLPMG